MNSAISLSNRQSPPATAAMALPSYRELVIVILVGVASALLGPLLGRALRGWSSIPTLGSIAVALPRALVLLVMLRRVSHFGALTAAAVAEIGAKLFLGLGGLAPMFIAAPLVAGLAGDLIWTGLGRVAPGRVRLMLTGAGLCAARVLAALILWSLLGPALSKAANCPASWAAGIVAINAGLGLTAGFLASGRKKSRIDDQDNG